MLTKRQRTILELFKLAEDERLPPPTMRAMAETLELSPGTVTDHVKRMVRDNWLEQPDGHNKYRMTERAREMLRRIHDAEAKSAERKKELQSVQEADSRAHEADG